MMARCWLAAALLVVAGSLLPAAPAVSAGAPHWIYLVAKTDTDGRILDWHADSFEPTSRQLGLPLDPAALDWLQEHDIRIRFQSRWLNAVSAELRAGEVDRLRAHPLIAGVEPVRRLTRTPSDVVGKPLVPSDSGSLGRHGWAYEQLAQIGVTALHRAGLDGTGVRVALLDNGYHYTEHPAFAQLQVIAARDFINGNDTVTDQTDQPVTGDETRSDQNIHGAQVLSLIAGDDAGRFVGVAPRARFILGKTEDNGEEMPIEEDRWVAGLEWADSLGADIVSSSLGYTTWDDGTGYTFDDLDGRTTVTARAAAAAVQRGMVVVVAAGNEAGTVWNAITTPADAPGVIAVGSVDVPLPGTRDPVLASTSSHGPTADGRIKPDLVAPGQGVVAANIRGGGYMRVHGTSFAAPLVAGVCALLLQAQPEWTPEDVLEALRSTALDLGETGPDNLYGWGQVDARAASGLDTPLPDAAFADAPFPNPVRAADHTVHFPVMLTEGDHGRISIFSVSGQLVFTKEWSRYPGEHTDPGQALVWDIGRMEAERNERLASGVLYYRLTGKTISRRGSLAVVRGDGE